MGGEFLTPQEERGEQSPLVSYADIFREHFPIYLAWGMSADDYWNGDCTLVIAYRKKHDYEQKKRNYELWLQGLYIYEAMLCVSPVFHDFAKNPKPLPYRDKPFPLNSQDSEQNQKIEEEQAREMQKSKLIAWMEKVNKKMRKQNDEC